LTLPVTAASNERAFPKLKFQDLFEVIYDARELTLLYGKTSRVVMATMASRVVVCCRITGLQFLSVEMLKSMEYSVHMGTCARMWPSKGEDFISSDNLSI